MDIIKRVREYRRAGSGDQACEDAVNAILHDIKEELAFKDSSLLSNEKRLNKKAKAKSNQLLSFFAHVTAIAPWC